MEKAWRTGIGYDLHPLISDRVLRLGGVTIAGERGLGGHSDGDVVLHALIDALLGAVGWPDIGEQFPDTDSRWRGIDSTQLMDQVIGQLLGAGWRINNVDLVIIAQKPKLSPWKEAIRKKLAELCRVSTGQVGVKAKTNEGFDAVGRQEAIACQVIATVIQNVE
ncbi:MAG: 2-C-methyl-D-erythritol 2,4-cyclodiphosphate synthase [Phycisphaerae bacterium]|nr:2-C-methyl-D-erythritol 2,4-cyclodiphosphate synthase [Phycisphaerae bacterium]